MAELNQQTNGFIKLQQVKSPQRQQRLKSQQSDYKGLLQAFSRTKNEAFYTQLKQISQKQSLDSYIDALQKKIFDAQWKQDLLLNYNYMPLQTIKEKIDIQTQNYQKKIDRFKADYNKVFEDSDFTSQLEKMRQFNLKLKQKMKDYQLKIQQRKVLNTVLKNQADDKRLKLKKQIKENMELSKNIVENMGANNKEDLVRMVKSRSQMKLRKKGLSQSSKNLENLPSVKRSNSVRSLKRNLKNNLFEQCLSKLIDNIKGMKSSQDIQGGIYLQIMKKKSVVIPSVAKATHRSTISNTLYERYKPKIHKSKNQHYEQDDFEMDWDTFKQLNWKQILGILLIKDKDCSKLKAMFKK